MFLWFLFCPLSASLCNTLKVLTYCAGLSGTTHPAFQHVSFKGMAHAQFAVSKMVLFVSTVSSLPNRKCNAAPPGAAPSGAEADLLQLCSFVGCFEPSCLQQILRDIKSAG